MSDGASEIIGSVVVAVVSPVVGFPREGKEGIEMSGSLMLLNFGNTNMYASPSAVMTRRTTITTIILQSTSEPMEIPNEIMKIGKTRPRQI